MASFSCDQHEEQGCDEEQDPEELTQAKLPSSALICKVYGFPDGLCDFYAYSLRMNLHKANGAFCGFQKMLNFK